jgi:3-isopropylmalate/(R)-2-methylmalate dehydratase small subunit
MSATKVALVTGRAVAVHGDDIDTDRIIPARFLKAISFAGLERHVFEDERREAERRGAQHPFDVPAHQGAHVLLVNSNFGCGSSREHAPQAIKRWGVEAVIGESFAEIFFGNSLMIGLPCLTVSRDDMQALMALADAQPDLEFRVDVAAQTVTAGSLTVTASLPAPVREALVTGAWDATGQLLENYTEVTLTAGKLPYLTGFGG